MLQSWVIAYHWQLQATIQQVLQTAPGAGAGRNALGDIGHRVGHFQSLPLQESSTGLLALKQPRKSCVSSFDSLAQHVT